jgi:hypothetical protein
MLVQRIVQGLVLSGISQRHFSQDAPLRDLDRAVIQLSVQRLVIGGK